MLLCNGLRRPRGNCIKLRAKGSRTHRLASQSVSVARILLVPHILGAYRHAHEPYRPKEDCAHLPCRNSLLAHIAAYRRRLHDNARRFSLLGIGNAIMQTSLNPLVTNLISSDKLASTLTFGQFVKAIASFRSNTCRLGATTYLPTFGLGWRALFAIYAVISFLSISVLGATPIEEERPDKASGIGACLKLLGRPFILLCFLGIMCHVGIDVGTNTTAPKIIMERLGLPLEEAGFATSIYFIFRTAGCFLGAFILRSVPGKTLLRAKRDHDDSSNGNTDELRHAIYHIRRHSHDRFRQLQRVLNNLRTGSELIARREKRSVGTHDYGTIRRHGIPPLAMGYAADTAGQNGAVAVMAAGVIYLLYYTLKIKK